MSRPRASRSLALLVAAPGGLLILSAPAAADPVYANGSAQSVIDELESNGYNVVINWLTGYDTKSLSVCWVSSINNPGEWNPPPRHLHHRLCRCLMPEPRL